jgi:hypothetical protein
MRNTANWPHHPNGRRKEVHEMSIREKARFFDRLKPEDQEDAQIEKCVKELELIPLSKKDGASEMDRVASELADLFIGRILRRSKYQSTP